MGIQTWSQTIITRRHTFLKSKIKTRCKIFLFLFLIFRLSLSNSHFQKIKLINLLFTKYKSKFIRVAMNVSVVLWIIITVTLKRILFEMSSVIAYRHNQLKSLSWIYFSCVCVYILSPWRLLPSAKCPRHTWGYGSTILCCEY